MTLHVGENGDQLDPLPLDVCIAGPPAAAAASSSSSSSHATHDVHDGLFPNGNARERARDGDGGGEDDENDDREEEDVVVLYVLDPEPMMFGAAALFAFAQAAYGAHAPGSVEAVFCRMHVVGVGHAAGSFGLDGGGLDTAALRRVRRRDFCARDHPAIKPGRGRNAAAARFVDGLVDEVIPFVEERVLGLHRGAQQRKRVRRAILVRVGVSGPGERGRVCGGGC